MSLPMYHAINHQWGTLGRRPEPRSGRGLRTSRRAGLVRLPGLAPLLLVQPAVVLEDLAIGSFIEFAERGHAMMMDEDVLRADHPVAGRPHPPGIVIILEHADAVALVEW